MPLHKVLTDDLLRLIEFEEELREAWEAEGHTMDDTALIVPVTQTAGEERFVNLAISQIIGVNITSPEPGVFRISHLGCSGIHSGCVIDGVPTTMDSAEAQKVLLRLMTVTNVLATAHQMAREMLDGE